MKTEAEIKEAVQHLTNALKAPIASGFPKEVAMARASIDLLRWVLGEPSRFQDEVIDPCRAVDRAERQ